MKAALTVFVLTATLGSITLFAQSPEIPKEEGVTDGAIARPRNPLPGAAVNTSKIRQIDRRTFEDQMENRLSDLDNRIAQLQVRLENHEATADETSIADIERRRSSLEDLMTQLRSEKNSGWDRTKSKITRETAELEGRIARLNDQLKK